MNKIALLSVLFSLIQLPAISQVEEAQSSKTAQNVIHGNFGIVGANINYERTFREFEKSRLNWRAGFGWVVDFDLESNANFIGSVQYITGVKWFHFEAGLGLNLMVGDRYIDDLSESRVRPHVLPLIMVGFRIEPPVRGPVIRLGVGTEGSIMSAGLGWKF